MGTTIFYRITVRTPDEAKVLLRAARREAKSRGWVVEPMGGGGDGIEVLPHKKCEPVRLAFSPRLVCDEFTKTQYAPLKTHIEVVEFLRALQPLAKRMTVDDEGEYWQTGDKDRLKRIRGEFERAMGVLKGEADADAGEITFTLGAVTIDSTGKVKVAKSPTVVTVSASGGRSAPKPSRPAPRGRRGDRKRRK